MIVHNLRHLDADTVEASIVDYYRTLKLPPEVAVAVRTTIGQTLAKEKDSETLLRRQLAAEIRRLDNQEENLLDLVADGTVSTPKAKARLGKIALKREHLQEQLGHTDLNLEAGAAFLQAALDLLEDPQDLYRQAGDEQRRLINDAFFERLYIDEDGVCEPVFQPPFDVMLAKGRRRRSGDHQTGGPDRASEELDDLWFGRGSSKRVMVGAEGLEPPTCSL